MTHDLNATNRFPSGPQGESAEPAEPALVLLESVAFQEFDQLIDAELERLVQRWIHTAAPNANRPQLGRARFAP